MRGACVWWGGGGERAGGVRVWVCVRGGGYADETARGRPSPLALAHTNRAAVSPARAPVLRPRQSTHAHAHPVPVFTHAFSLQSVQLSFPSAPPEGVRPPASLFSLAFFAPTNPTHHASHHRLLRPRPRLRGRRLRARLVPAHQGPRRPGARPERRAPRPPGRPPAALGRPVSGWRPAPRLGRRRPARAPGPHPF